MVVAVNLPWILLKCHTHWPSMGVTIKLHNFKHTHIRSNSAQNSPHTSIDSLPKNIAATLYRTLIPLFKTYHISLAPSHRSCHHLLFGLPFIRPRLTTSYPNLHSYYVSPTIHSQSLNIQHTVLLTKFPCLQKNDVQQTSEEGWQLAIHRV